MPRQPGHPPGPPPTPDAFGSEWECGARQEAEAAVDCVTQLSVTGRAAPSSRAGLGDADTPPSVLLLGAWRVVWDPGGAWYQPLTPREAAQAFGGVSLPSSPAGGGAPQSRFLQGTPA